MIRIDLKKRKPIYEDPTYLVSFAFMVLLLVGLHFGVGKSEKATSNYHAMSIEERETVFSVIGRLDQLSELRPMNAWLTEALLTDSIPVLVTTKKLNQLIELKSEGALVISEQFFGVDPVTQDMSVAKLVVDAQKFLPVHPPSEIAKLPKK